MYYEIIKYKNINRPLFITTLCNIYSSLFPIFIHLHNSLLLGFFLLLILMFCFSKFYLSKSGANDTKSPCALPDL